MIYVDSPAGAGLSYSKAPQDYNTDDEQTVEDLYSFLMELFTLMPELSYQRFYIAGKLNDLPGMSKHPCQTPGQEESRIYLLIF
jgi:hypothetical protein